jgi:hypothetical protein
MVAPSPVGYLVNRRPAGFEYAGSAQYLAQLSQCAPGNHTTQALLVDEVDHRAAQNHLDELIAAGSLTVRGLASET